MSNYTVYMNPKTQDRGLVTTLFGRPAANRLSKQWRPNSALVYDFYEIHSVKVFDRAVRHVNQYPDSVIVINFSHESMPSSIVRADEYPIIQQLIERINPPQLVVLLCQQDTILSVQKHLPGVGTLYINSWESLTPVQEPTETRRTRIGSFHRRYSAPRALWMYTMRNYLDRIHYTFGDRGYWDPSVPPSVFQHTQLKTLGGLNPELKHRVETWQNQQRPWRQFPGVDSTEWNHDQVLQATRSVQHCAVIESRADAQPRSSGFLTEKTFRPIAAQTAVYPLTEGAGIEQYGYEPYILYHSTSWIERVGELALHMQQLIAMSEAEYQHHQNTIAEKIHYNTQHLLRRNTTQYKRSTAPERLKPYFQ